jgi:WS/DGAT/MGAT family acyltransferase
MTRIKRAKMSAVDTAWLRMDRPGNLMMITGVMVFDRHVRLERVKRVIGERFLRFPRFRQRPVRRSGVSYWEDAPDFSIDDHVVKVSLPGRAGTKELQALVSRLASRPLDPARPWWRYHLVDNFERGSALIAQFHHCYADGIALVRVVMSMTDAAANGPPAMPFHPVPKRALRRADDPLAELLQPISGVMKLVRKVGATLIEKGAEIWNDPAKAVMLAEQGGALTAELARLALMPQDSPTRFKGKPGIAKEVAWAEPLPLDEIKTVAKALGASINDVLLSCVAGALAAYLAQKGDATDGVMVRALVPVNLRPIEEAWRLGNQFGLVFLDLPIGIGNPVERLYAVRANMNALKGSYQPVVALGLLAAMGAGPDGAAGGAAAGAGAQRHRRDDECAGTAAAFVFRGRGDRAHPLLGAAIGRHRNGRVDPVVRRAGSVRAHHRPRAVPGSRRSQQALRFGIRKAAVGHAPCAVAARRGSRPCRRGARRGRRLVCSVMARGQGPRASYPSARRLCPRSTACPLLLQL